MLVGAAIYYNNQSGLWCLQCTHNTFELRKPLVRGQGVDDVNVRF